jgi:hypothetical protein
MHPPYGQYPAAAAAYGGQHQAGYDPHAYNMMGYPPDQNHPQGAAHQHQYPNYNPYQKQQPYGNAENDNGYAQQPDHDQRPYPGY